MKRALIIFTAFILLVAAVPAVSFAADEPAYMEAIGGLNKTDFLCKYAMTGSVEPATGDFVGTGSTLTRDGQDYNVIVRGDINGDGQIKSVDYLRIKKYFTGQPLEGIELMAADVNCDNDIKSVDYLKIKSYLKGAAELWSADAYVGERYLGYRIWNFSSWQPMSTYQRVIPRCKAYGFNMINFHFAWYIVEAEEGVYDWSQLDEILDYIIFDQGMKVAAIIYLGRIIDDGYLEPEDFARSYDGKNSGEGEGRAQISFSSLGAVEKAVRFYKKAVEHINERYGKNIVMYLSCVSHYAEMEYSVDGKVYDYCDYSKNAFKEFLKVKYETIENFNNALGTRYKSFDTITPPGSSVDDFGLLWYQFKQQELTNFINKLADATHEVDPSLKYCLQFGSVADSTAVSRAVMDLKVVAEKADIVWVDDGPQGNHEFSMDYLRNFLGKDYEIGNEIDGPGFSGTTIDDYLNQGLTSYEKGAKYVVCANWSDPNNIEWGSIWETLRDTWLTFEKHEVDEIPANSPSYDISLYDLFRSGCTVYEGFYKQSIKLNILDDLTNYTPGIDEKRAPSYPSDYSTIQGINGWTYNYINKGKAIPLTYSANRWINGSMYFMKNICNPGAKQDLSLDYTVDAECAGDVNIEYMLTPIYSGGNGVGLAILVNEEQVFSASDYATATYNATLKGTTDAITVKEGDVISFRISSLGESSSDISLIRFVIK